MMAERKSYLAIDGRRLKYLLAGSLRWLEANHEHVNSLNVFPVPDGDTGTNMLLTVRKAYESVARSSEEHVGRMASMMAQGALRGARGNSGTILSMLFRGFATPLEDVALMDAGAFVSSARHAVDYTYESVRRVMEPVEGTILTVARLIAEALESAYPEKQDLGELLDVTVFAAQAALLETPKLLPVLQQAGVVDSGGMGLLLIFEGSKQFAEGVMPSAASTTRLHAPVQESVLLPEPDAVEGYGYDVQFLLVGEGLDVERIQADIAAIGWSPLVEGDANLVKVHVHVHDPSKPLAYAMSLGAALDDIVVENMQLQYQRYVEQRHPNPPPLPDAMVISVGRGEGIRNLMSSLGAVVLEGGPSMNTGVEDFVEAIRNLAAHDIVLLPNNKNIFMAAEEAARIAGDKRIIVLKSASIQQGIAALFEYSELVQGEVAPVAIAQVMEQTIQAVTSLDLTRAVRTTTIGDLEIQHGQCIALVDGALVSVADTIDEAALAAMDQLHGRAWEIGTVYYGEDVTEAEAQDFMARLNDRFPLEYQLIDGGQPFYPYLISLE
jgi:uncharacterized protein